MPVGTASLDQSCFGCWDMASNGYEWTSSVWTRGVGEPGNEDELVPFNNAIQKCEVVLRGTTYLDENPFEFKKCPPKGLPDYEDRFPESIRSDISFRVVLKVPAP